MANIHFCNFFRLRLVAQSINIYFMVENKKLGGKKHKIREKKRRQPRIQPKVGEVLKLYIEHQINT